MKKLLVLLLTILLASASFAQEEEMPQNTADNKQPF